MIPKSVLTFTYYDAAEIATLAYDIPKLIMLTEEEGMKI